MRRAVMVLLVAGVAGCTGPVTPPLAAPTPAAPSGAASSAAAAPAVVAPRDGSGLHGCAAPTALLAPDLVSAAGATPAGDGCTWTTPDPPAVLRADVRAAGGLDALHRAAGAFRAFRTGELSGLPTVVTTPPDDPSCSLHVGLSGGPGGTGEVLTVQVGPAVAPVPDPCRVATTAAARLLAAMPPARRTPGGPP